MVAVKFVAIRQMSVQQSNAMYEMNMNRLQLSIRSMTVEVC